MDPSHVSYLQGLIATKATSKPAGKVAKAIHHNERIGTVRGMSMSYSERDHQAAENLLRSRGFAIVAPAGRGLRSEASDASSEKTNALNVTEGLVAVRFLNMGLESASPVGFAALPWRDALQLPFEAMLVCENLEPLMHLQTYEWLEHFVQGRPVLALYRGAREWFKTKAAADAIASDHRPTLAFFDFDPKGLSMAASLPRRKSLCLPPLSALEARARAMQRTNLFAQSYATSWSHLEQVHDAEIQNAWQLMKRLATGLDQEGFPRS